MLNTVLAFQWFSAAFFLLPVAGYYSMPTFYEDEFRKKKVDSEGNQSKETYTFRQAVSSPEAWIFTPIWWVVCMATAAVAILYWQDPSVVHPDRADTVFGLLYALPFLELLWTLLFFRPYSFVGAAIVAWIILIDYALLWVFIIWSGNTDTPIMILLVIPSLWLLIAAPWTTWVAYQFDVRKITNRAEAKRKALNELLEKQMKKTKLNRKFNPVELKGEVRRRETPSHTLMKINRM
jgi:tryptophan-rich sensory protein